MYKRTIKSKHLKQLTDRRRRENDHYNMNSITISYPAITKLRKVKENGSCFDGVHSDGSFPFTHFGSLKKRRAHKSHHIGDLWTFCTEKTSS